VPTSRGFRRVLCFGCRWLSLARPGRFGGRGSLTWTTS